MRPLTPEERAERERLQAIIDGLDRLIEDVWALIEADIAAINGRQAK